MTRTSPDVLGAKTAAGADTLLSMTGLVRRRPSRPPRSSSETFQDNTPVASTSAAAARTGVRSVRWRQRVSGIVQLVDVPASRRSRSR